MTYRSKAAAAIHAVHMSLPEKCPLDERVKAVDAAYPFGLRQFYPYKVWLEERFKYLQPYGYVKKGVKVEQTPLERRIELQKLIDTPGYGNARRQLRAGG